jgi:hypothetical protein
MVLQVDAMSKSNDATVPTTLRLSEDEQGKLAELWENSNANPRLRPTVAALAHEALRIGLESKRLLGSNE